MTMSEQCVLISIRPKWCELIASGKKTIEVRKSRPKLDTPFKCYIYCTVGGDALCPPHMNSPKWDIHRQGNGTAKGRKMTARERDKSDYRFANGKVIGDFMCDQIKKHSYDDFIGAVNADGSERTEAIQGEGTYWFWENERKKTCLSQDEIFKYGGTKPLYAWHISALQIYDKPRKLSEFHKPIMPMGLRYEDDAIKRPPQSWAYVEEYDGRR